MNLITEIREQDINPDAPKIDSSNFERREAVRAVVVNEIGQVALLNVTKRGFRKLPGGGVEPGEDKTEALKAYQRALTLYQSKNDTRKVDAINEKIDALR